MDLGTEIKMAALVHLFTFGVVSYLAVISAFLGYCFVKDRTRQHGRDAYAVRAKADQHRSDGSGEWAAGF